MGNIGVWNVDDKGIEHRGTLKMADQFDDPNELIEKTSSVRFKKAMTQLNEIEEIFT